MSGYVNYQLTAVDRLLHDIEPEFTGFDLRALVASDDCFQTLASRLDQLSHTVEMTDPLRSQLENIILALLQLQRDYRITKKI